MGKAADKLTSHNYRAALSRRVPALETRCTKDAENIVLAYKIGGALFIFVKFADTEDINGCCKKSECLVSPVASSPVLDQTVLNMGLKNQIMLRFS